MLAQCSMQGFVFDQEKVNPIPYAHVKLGDTLVVTTDKDGFYKIDNLNTGNYEVRVSYLGYETYTNKHLIKPNLNIYNISLQLSSELMSEVQLSDKIQTNQNLIRLNAIEGTSIYAAKKNEVILIENSMGNKATNNSRQLYSKVPGLNIWESDGLGMQLEIGARGLSPHRTSNFNTRQNGCDISADALGYPESYYTPPSEVIDRIQLVRGAASLQYGTQFGGLLNFVLKDGANKPLELTARQSIGSFGLYTSSLSIGGSKSKWRYYTFYQKKSRKGWRNFSSTEAQCFYTSLKYQANEKFAARIEFTHMDYLSQQPGGLNDDLFASNPDTALRSRNWFRVNWNIAAMNLDYKFSTRTTLNSRTFALWASRDALGVVDNQYVVDSVIMIVKPNRDLQLSQFQNFGNETRLMHRYLFFNRESALLLGTRFYSGNTIKDQGVASSKSDADFSFENKYQHFGSHFKFPSFNQAVFIENLFRLSNSVTVTPGMRYDRIKTQSEGYFHHFINDSLYYYNSNNTLDRHVLLFGIGTSYKSSIGVEYYANYSQNYRAINFNDMQVINSNIVIDPKLSDEMGCNIDIGVRGKVFNKFNFDMSVFYLSYRDRIGYLSKYYNETDTPSDNLLYTSYRLSTNIGDSRTIGLESYFSLDIIEGQDSNPKLNVFLNGSYQQGYYVNSEEESIEGNKVELNPDINLKFGVQYSASRLSIAMLYSYTSSQYTDAQNTITPSNNALFGAIPAYSVFDLSAKYEKSFYTIECGVNNLFNKLYYTRRASGYPGPGIIPSDVRNMYLSLQLTL